MSVLGTIVLTGGPCSGKTSAKAVLMQKLPELQIYPVFIPETATQLLGSGISIPHVLSPGRVDNFQELVLTHQINSEEIFHKLADMQPETVVICDRGAMDGAAYMERSAFADIIRKKFLTIGRVMSRYDGVIHLVTAADGAEAYYNLDNPARYETPQQAREVDKKLQQAWSGHPCLRIIDNVNTDFGKKMDRVIAEVCNIIGIPVPVESEKKFLLSADTSHLDWPTPTVAISIVQTYLVSDKPDVERRIRQWKYGEGDVLYFYTEKRAKGTSGLTRFESERQIDADEYIALLRDRDKSREDIVKTRHCFAYGNEYLELDIITQPQALCLLEVQASDMQRHIELPKFFEYIKEVTDDPRYKNAAIAAGICPGYNESV